MGFAPGQPVEHPDFGPGVVEEVLGNIVTVRFYGERVDVPAEELEVIKVYQADAALAGETCSPEGNDSRRRFRKAFEAINLGVVPPDPDQLIDLSIGGAGWTSRIGGWLQHADIDGLCKVVFGYYGAGKSHFLHLARCIALQNRWVVAFLEFDPKSADPARPHLIYRNIASSLQFPEREDGTTTRGFRGFIREIREKWESKNIRYGCKYLNKNKWFSNGLEILIKYPHSQDSDYLAACAWLAGENEPIRAMNSLAAAKGVRNRVPSMPRSKETADIYVLHLVTIHHLCKCLGYAGLLVILDEAEHVRGYNVRRRERANNLFDLLARASHSPVKSDMPPIANDHGADVPQYWNDGPHFGLLVGLTPQEELAGPGAILREQCVFLHEDSDRINLETPGPEDYERWCEHYLGLVHLHYPYQTAVLSVPSDRKRISRTLRTAYEGGAGSEQSLRNWIKLASLIPCMVLAGRGESIEDLISTVERVAAEYRGELLPWE